jgi:hypothetical protein
MYGIDRPSASLSNLLRLDGGSTVVSELVRQADKMSFSLVDVYCNAEIIKHRLQFVQYKARIAAGPMTAGSRDGDVTSDPYGVGVAVRQTTLKSCFKKLLCATT